MKKVLLLIVGAVLLFFVINGIRNSYYASKGRVFLQNEQVLLDSWYQHNNPSHNPAGRQPTEEDMRKIRINARKGL